MTTLIRHATFALLVLAADGLGAAPVRAGGDWNDKGIAWQPYDAGLALAKKENKPVCLVFFTPDCALRELRTRLRGPSTLEQYGFATASGKRDPR